ncbi:MAG: AAA family ATPase [Anaerolinea sp.]|nr:AAA family ATPase [Anaerolinea sp.]
MINSTALNLTFFSRFHAALNGRSLHRFESDNARALLVYLVLEAPHAHRRAHLASLFWPDHAEKDARNNLRQTLFKLRRALHDDQRDPPYLLVNNQTVQWNPVWMAETVVDVWQLTAVLDQLASGQPIPPESVLNLYTGPLLADAALQAGLGFEEWLLIKREQLHQRVMAALTRLIEAATANQQWATAGQIASRQIALDSWREESYRQLMWALAAQGERTAALALFEQCRAVLWQELGVPPTPETVALYEQIRQEDEPRPAAVPLAPSPLSHNLPVDLTPFIGRELLLEQAAGCLSDPACRLLTLNGLGGIGKTRLAVQLARHLQSRFADGVWLVNLDSLPSQSSREQLSAAISAALPFTPASSAPLRQQLANYLRQRHLLLLCDNFEHLLPLADHLLALLADAPGVQCVVTSRQPLGVPGEWLLPVPPLAYPATTDSRQPEQYEAARLFFQQARMARPDFPLSVVAEPFVAQICRLVEGHPLALELAASWVDTLSCREIAAEIANGLTLLHDSAGQRPLRHASIGQIMHQSWARLSDAERRTVNRMAVFAGGGTRTAVEQIAEATLPILKTVVSRSLVQMTVTAQRSPRYSLHELARHYAATALIASGERDAARQQHARYYADLLTAQAPLMSSAQAISALQTIQPEADNLNAAWQWAVETADCAFFAQTVGVATAYWQNNSQYEQGVEMVTAALAVCADSPIAYRWQNRLASLRNFLAVDTAVTLELLLEAFTAAQLANDPREAAYACLQQGVALRRSSQFAAAWETTEAGLGLIHPEEDLWLTSSLANQLCNLASLVNRLEEGTHYGQLALTTSTRMGHPPSIWTANYVLAQLALRQSKLDEAESYIKASWAALGEHPFPYHRANSRQLQGFIVYAQGDWAAAGALFAEADSLNRAVGDPTLTGTVQGMMAHLALKQRRWAEAVQMGETAVQTARLAGDRWRLGQVLLTLALASEYTGQRQQAAVCFQEALALADSLQEVGLQTVCLIAWMEWLALLGQRPLAEELVAGLRRYFTLTAAWQEEVAALCGRFGLGETAVPQPWPVLKEKLEDFILTSRLPPDRV